MNPITPPDDIDARARAAGAAVRTRGTDVADTDRAWSDLVRVLDTDDGVVVDLDRERFDRAPGGGRRWLGVAAALVVVMGLVATFVAVRSGSDDDPVAAPMGQWLLPAAESGFRTSSGSVSESTGNEPGIPRTVSVVGRAAGDRIGDLVQVTVADAPPDGAFPDDNNGWEQVDTAAGEVWRFMEADRFADLAQQRGDRWIMTMSAPEDEAVAIELLATSSIDPGGTVVLDPATGFELLETVSFDSAVPSFVITSYQVNGPGINEDGIGPVLVETIDSVGSLLAASGLGETVRPVDIQGHPGWEVARPDVDGESWGYIWNVDGVSIAVSGHDDAATVRAVAESLVTVDEATWRTATGAGPTETIAP